MPKSRGCICDVVFGGIKRSGETVGHVPFNLPPIMSAFLKRSCNKGLVEVSQSWSWLRIRNPMQVSFLWSTLYRAVGSILPLGRRVLVEKANL